MGRIDIETETVAEFGEYVVARTGTTLSEIPVITSLPARGMVVCAHHTGLVVVEDARGELGVFDTEGSMQVALVAFRKALAGAYAASGRQARQEDMGGSFEASALYGKASSLDRTWCGMLSAS